MNLESKYACVFLALGALVWGACEPVVPTDLTLHTIIPHPVEITASGEAFLLTDQTRVITTDERLRGAANHLLLSMGIAQGAEAADDAIVLSLSEPDSLLGDEGYQLRIEEDQINISASHAHGVFNGVQTLLQLIPTADESLKPTRLATGLIRDYPRYSYRGAMLDVARHFFDVKDVKRFIDFLVAYKMNVLHLHLTDDQGWRIEIKSKPELTNIGAATEVGGAAGGFYTQDEYKEIVQYAADRFITIIPEIDMPGHTQAALASYEVLNCDGKAGELYTGTKVGFSTLCTRSEATYEFVDAVIGELAAMTPGPYIHIGGDESHVTEKEDYIYFVNRVQQIVSKYGKTMIGWDEIAQSQIDPQSLVQQWSSAGNAMKAVENGNQVILSPATRTYMDMKYDSTTSLGLSWAALIEVDHGYQWDPDTLNAGMPAEFILGVEAPLWGETIEDMDDIEYLIFPRLPGYAEVGWSPQEVRVWEGYRNRLAYHAQWFEANGINYYKSPQIDWKPALTDIEDVQVEVDLK